MIDYAFSYELVATRSSRSRSLAGAMRAGDSVRGDDDDSNEAMSYGPQLMQETVWRQSDHCHFAQASAVSDLAACN